jgi:hypothetical protein
MKYLLLMKGLEKGNKEGFYPFLLLAVRLCMLQFNEIALSFAVMV